MASNVQELQIRALGERLRRERKKRKVTLRTLAAEIMVSPSTLSRIERGEEIVPDTRTLTSITRWLNLPLEQFMHTRSPSESEIALPDRVEMHLRADRHLGAEAADRLASMFRLAYEAAATSTPTKDDRSTK